MAHFIKSLSLTKAHREIQPFSIDFMDGLNVIVGENGSGKSSLLDLITTDHKDYKKVRSINYAAGASFRFLDTEKHNPRAKNDLSNSVNIGFDISSRFVSHGEAMLPLILASKDFKDVLLMVDEPESGISLNNQKKIFKALQACVKNNCQVIITTHSYVLIKSVDTVFSMDDKKWVSSKEYLSHLKLF